MPPLCGKQTVPMRYVKQYYSNRSIGRLLPAVSACQKDFDKLVDGGASSPATATLTSFC